MERLKCLVTPVNL